MLELRPAGPARRGPERVARRTAAPIANDVRGRTKDARDPTAGIAHDCCLHCVLERVLQKEMPGLLERGSQLILAPLQRLHMPMTGRALYRVLRRFIHDATQRENGHVIRVAVIDIPGKSYVEVSVSIRGAQPRGRVRSCPLPRYVAGSLECGFAEGVYPVAFTSPSDAGGTRARDSSSGHAGTRRVAASASTIRTPG